MSLVNDRMNSKQKKPKPTNWNEMEGTATTYIFCYFGVAHSPRPLPFIIDSCHRRAVLSDPTQIESVPSHFYSINKQLKAMSDVLSEVQCWKFTTSKTWRCDQ
jgi:hypothetical protein